MLGFNLERAVDVDFVFRPGGSILVGAYAPDLKRAYVNTDLTGLNL